MRQNFPKSVLVARFKHCESRCEQCTAVLIPGRWHGDHANPDGLTGKPTFENCRCLCLSCHAAKTAQDQANIALAKRREAADIGAERPSARGFRKAEKAPKVSAKTPLPRRAIYVERT